VIFDTDVLIWFFRGAGNAKDLIESESSPAISIVSLMELIQGVKSLTNLKAIRQFFPTYGFRVIPINESISHLAVTLMEEHSLSHGLQLADALIAATARETGSILATGNVRHFRTIPRLELKAFRLPGAESG
jgi:predicted nucleic acid-binding protein